MVRIAVAVEPAPAMLGAVSIRKRRVEFYLHLQQAFGFTFLLIQAVANK
jgi:hypothetical protein